MPRFGYLVFLAGVLSAFVPSTAHAGSFVPETAAVIVQSTATDTDAWFLSYFAGFSPSESLSYASTTTPAGWTGTMTGTYRGSNVNVGYSSTDLSNYPSGPMTWTTTGTYGAGSFDGGGSASFTFSGTSFSLAFSDSITYGGNTLSLSYNIPGSVQTDGTIMFGTPSNPEVGTGTLKYNSSILDIPIIYSYKMIPKYPGAKNPWDYKYVLSDINDIPIPFRPWNNNVYFSALPNGGAGMNSTIQSVPEPSSLVQLGLGILGLAGGGWKLRRRSL